MRKSGPRRRQTDVYTSMAKLSELFDGIDFRPYR